MSDTRMDGPPGGRRVYLGRLPDGVQKRDVEDFFAPISFLDVRIMGPFGFVEFNDPVDADKAVAQSGGKPLLGADIICEKAKENQRRRDQGGDSYGGDRRGPPERRGPGPGRGVRLSINGLTPDVSWQDLKDFGREAGAVIYADVNRSGEGVLEYATMGEAENAIERLSAQTIRGAKVEIALDDSRGPPPRSYDRGADRGGDRGGYDRGYDRGGPPGGGRGGYERDSYRGDRGDSRRSPPRRDYGGGGGGGRYDDRERDRDYRDRSPPRRGGDRDRSPPPRSRDYGREERRSPPPPTREREPIPRRGDDREYR